jgi:methylenetetrahydrofolate reductase (NADPH)
VAGAAAGAGGLAAPWEASVRLPDGAPAAAPDPGYFLFEGGGPGWEAPAPLAGARWRYRALRVLHAGLFHPRSPVHLALRPLARRVAPGSALDAALGRLERWAKAPAFGCQACGFCRLPHTLYVCPETCPKGLANGPCGGSTGNVCEAGDRECVHTARYRLAKATGQLALLERTLIPAVPGSRAARRGSATTPAATRDRADA